MANVNFSQTRKSRLAGLGEDCAACVEKICGEQAQIIWDAKVKVAASLQAAKRRRVEAPAADGADGVEGDGGIPAQDANVAMPLDGIMSVAFLGGTIEQVRARCAGDTCTAKQTKVAQRLPGLLPATLTEEAPDLTDVEKPMAVKLGLQGRLWHGHGLIFDQVYQLLQDISILDQPSSKKLTDQAGAGQTPMAGWFNRLLQTGRSDHETKTCGSHGGLEAPRVSVSLSGNFHPTPAIEMSRGLRGDHGCQAKARLMLVTGTPVQPRAAYELGEVGCKSVWWRIPNEVVGEIFGNVGLAEGFGVHDFQAAFQDTGPEESLEEDLTHVPNEEGYTRTLADGVGSKSA